MCYFCVLVICITCSIVCLRMVLIECRYFLFTTLVDEREIVEEGAYCHHCHFQEQEFPPSQGKLILMLAVTKTIYACFTFEVFQKTFPPKLFFLSGHYYISNIAMAIYAYHLANSYSGNTQPISHHMVYKYHHYNKLKVLKGLIKNVLL